MTHHTGSPPSRGRRAAAAAAVMAVWLAAMWVVTLADDGDGPCWHGDPDPALVCEYGVEPRQADELVDIVPAAFLHFGRDHLAANTMPLLVLGFVAALRGVGRFLAVVGVVIAVSGLGVWLTSAPGSLTAGASGVVFGLFSYVVTRGFVERDALDITVGIVVFLFYGSMLWGALPGVAASDVSWQAHLFGLVGGILAARWLRRRPPARPTPTPWPPG